jgi:hypothetical protein
MLLRITDAPASGAALLAQLQTSIARMQVMQPLSHRIAQGLEHHLQRLSWESSIVFGHCHAKCCNQVAQ